MTARARLPVVLLWHLHQPQYRDALTGRYVLPWTYLHAIKDYVDMAAHLEANSKARVVVNFTPVLIEQLEELAARVGAHLAYAAPLPDPVLAMLADAPLPDGAERLALLRACLRAHRVHMIDRYPEYARLAKLAETFDAIETIGEASDQYLRDLAVCYHLAWLGETVKRGDQRVAALLKHTGDFTPQQRRSLLELIGELLSGLLPRYRRLVDSGQCELSTSPFAHPILPLLLDFRTARESVPAAPLPHASGAYPGGAERAAWHLQEALRVFKRVFGVTPAGCWPSEGAISADTLTLIERHGWRWTASSESVLRNCLNGESRALTSGGGQPSSGGDLQAMQLYRIGGGQLNCLFRNDELSDLIGFTYSGWHGDDAVNNFVARLERLAQAEDEHPGRLLLVALDGENAWDHYPFNGYYFLKGLYAALAEHPLLELTTPSDLLARQPPATALPHVVAGSWVHGTLSTWIGERDKNAGWDLLVEAKQAFDAVVASGRLSADDRLHAEHQLALCESSDWFWWLGDYNSYEAVRDFDWLYRHQVTSFYRLLGLAVPASLAQPISIGRGAPEAGGVIRRALP